MWPAIAVAILLLLAVFLMPKPSDRAWEGKSARTGGPTPAASEPVARPASTSTASRPDDAPTTAASSGREKESPPSSVTVATVEKQALWDGELRLTSELRNAGNGTAVAALETVLWSAVNADTAVLTQMMVISFFLGPGNDSTAQTKEGRNALHTGLVKEAIARADNVGAVKVTEKRVFGDSAVLLKVKLFHANGSSTQEVIYLRNTPTGWRRDIGWKPGGATATNTLAPQ